MSRKKISEQSLEQKEFQVFNPENVKKTFEIEVKQPPPLEKIEIIEKQSKKKIKKEKKDKSKESYVLIITEKPQAASKIASALAEGKEKKNKNFGISYYELERNNKKIIVSCAIGHLFTLSQSKKSSDYPIFDIKWYPNFEIKKEDFTKKYFMLIKKLVQNASEIIIATDFDIEGEVIGLNIIRFIAKKEDAKRMKFSSLTAKEIQDSFENVLPTLEWGQAIAGETRHFIDWLYGINLSRALMNSIKKIGRFRIMSIGRVQGPALKLIVEREREIMNFKPTPYWQVFITINDGKNKLELKHTKDVIKKEDLEKFKNLEGKKTIAKTIKKKEKILPPPPFDLTTLQTEVYHFFSITPSQTMQIVQRLYLDGLISYPRTSSQKIPSTIDTKKILEQLSKKFKETEFVVREKPIEGKKSDPAHPAIIPTGINKKLEGNDEKVYNLIVKRFISCFCKDAEIENKKIEVEIENLKFSQKGMKILEPGWMNVYPAKASEKEIEDFNGEVEIEKIRIEEKMTQPPKRYSPASIILELEKKNLGTKATRAMIIETLYERNYIQGRSIQATTLGMKLIESMEKYSPIIIDENLTREMEKNMENIRSSKKDLEKKEKVVIEKAKETLTKISEDFKKNEKEIGEKLIEANDSYIKKERENNNLEIECPSCKKGKLSIKFSQNFKSYFVGCSNYPECKQTYPLPAKALIKKSDQNCENCGWPKLISIKKGKKPWIFCFNKNCYSKNQNTENSENKS